MAGHRSGIHYAPGWPAGTSERESLVVCDPVPGGLDGFRLHDLRHSCASFMLAAGASPRTVMKTLGHSQIGLTMNTYTHVLPEIERAAIDAAARTIFE